MTIGRKDDTGKLRWGLLRRSLVGPLESVIRVLMYGANKYGDDNWQAVENGKSRYRDALDRHLADIDKGILVDPDTGEPNMAHVATNALFLLWLHQKEQGGSREIGWFLNDGSNALPATCGVVVEVVLRDGGKLKGQARNFDWNISQDQKRGTDIVKWRYA